MPYVFTLRCSDHSLYIGHTNDLASREDVHNAGRGSRYTARRRPVRIVVYKGQYAGNTLAEYWAEGTQWWFWSNFEFYDGDVRVQSPDDLKAYDPALYALLDKAYIGHHIPADIYHGQNLRPARRQPER